ncbi:uncharacterized protein K441DRAFT_658786 [Cenococcum geophilum 1.58]|uniref:uncharacterized protein n=1 Tax=Cenococcum geophilum 1.58 TaxID=794803 RepID=UPI00358EF491|nr:hypothetical protein K441DRAFT_658786 [Cenococcum geophilum 1.58]
MNGMDVLSLLANLFGIFTFIIALAVPVLAFYTLTTNALKEIETLQAEWNNSGKEIYLLLKYWESERLRGNPDLENYVRGLQSSLDSLAETALSIYREIGELKPRTRSASIFDLDLRCRVLWTRKRRAILEKMAEFSRRRQGLIHMQLSLLLTYILSHRFR